jgi:hypothetical protein
LPTSLSQASGSRLLRATAATRIMWNLNAMWLWMAWI